MNIRVRLGTPGITLRSSARDKYRCVRILFECLSIVVTALWYLCLRSANCTVKHIHVTSKNSRIAEIVAKNESMSDIRYAKWFFNSTRVEFGCDRFMASAGKQKIIKFLREEKNPISNDSPTDRYDLFERRILRSNRHSTAQPRSKRIPPVSPARSI